MLSWKFFIAVLTLLCIYGFEKGSSAGVCTRSASRTSSRQESYTSNYYTSYRYYTSCGFLWLSRCARTGYRKRSRISYRREYYIDHYNEEYCCSGYTGSPPNCRRICPSLSRPSNGRVSVNSYYVGGRASYSCNSGYGVSGSSSRTCLSSGRWSPSQPTCQRVCSSPTSPSNGYVSVSSTFVGGIATYSCRSGYRLSGSSSRTCRQSSYYSSTWSGSQPSCIRVCPTLSSPRYGAVSVTTHDVGGRATYSCSTGYGVSDSSVLTCSSSGRWDRQPPTCKIVCPYPDPIRNGYMQEDSDSMFVGRTVSFGCNSGYRLSAPSNLTCLSSRRWSRTQPTCIRVCPNLHSPSNGRVSVNTYDIGGRATYTCDIGYKLSELSNRTCLSTGSWSGPVPSCEVVCSYPDPLINGRMQVEEDSMFVGGSIQFECDPGYQLSGSSNRICQSSRIWTGTQPTCIRICNILSSPRNGRVYVTSYEVDGVATYRCNSGYGMVGSSTRTCLSSGGWSEAEPECRILCPYPDKPRNGDVVVNSLLVGERATFACNPGYRLHGSSTRVCLPLGAWSGTQPVCIRVCPTLNSPANGRVFVSTYESGGIASFLCDDGYEASGLITLTCHSHGEWSGESPTCQVVCPTLRDPSNGRMAVTTYLDGGVATYVCSRGYYIYGNSIQRECKQGNWTGPEIICKALKCPSLAAPPLGNVSVTSHFPGGIATYTCDSGYELYGLPQSARYCTESGGWSGSQPTCRSINADSPASDCPSLKYGSLMEGQEEVAQSIMDDILSIDESISSDQVSQVSVTIKAFDSLANMLNTTRFETNFNQFIDALTEISIDKEEACSGELVTKNITQISEEFVRAFSTSPRNRDIAYIRSLYGQMLCIKKEEEKGHKNQTNTGGECPVGGIKKSTKPDEFFKCLDPEEIKSVFGFNELSDYPCLVFVIDTTGSMRDEIDDARNIILQFVRAEEEGSGCYMLVTFNDVGPDHSNVADKSVDPIVVAHTNNVTELLLFYHKVTTLKAIENSGGDLPEYALNALLNALEYTPLEDLPFPFLSPESQIVVLTDAPTKNKQLNTTVVEKANNLDVCIHFFLSHSSSRVDGVYDFVADETDGTVVFPYSSWSLANFVSSYKNNRCQPLTSVHVNNRKKRDSSHCDTFEVSKLASWFKFSGNSSSTVTLTGPRGKSIEVKSRRKIALHTEYHPAPGEWQACAGEYDTLQTRVEEGIFADASIVYSSKETNRSVIPPPECSKGEILLLSSKAALCDEINLNLLDKKKEAVKSVQMTGCGLIFVANMTFPHGSYLYQINGTDTSGIPILFNIKKSKVTFRKGEYDIKLADNSPTIMTVSEDVNYAISITNLNRYSSTFGLSARIPGMTLRSQPTEVTVPAKESVDVTVTIAVTSFSPHASSQTLTIEADNGCTQLRVSKFVRVVQPNTPASTQAYPLTMTTPSPIVTTPPPSECGCLNGGTCRLFTHRGRVYKRCYCPSGYSGSKCQRAS